MPLSVQGLARLLLVEDELDARALTAELLEQYGFHVESVALAQSAIEKLDQDCYSLVLADYITGNPHDAEREANQLLDAAAPGPVACLTGWSRIPKSLLNRFAFVMQKPFGVEALLAEIARVVDVEPCPGEMQVVLRYFEALTHKDWNALADLCTEDVIYRVSGHDPEHSQEIVGRKPFREFSERAFKDYPDASFDVRELSTLPKGAVARYRGRWTAPSQAPVALDAVVAFAFREQQVAQISVRIDFEHLHRLQNAQGMTSAEVEL